MPVTIRLLVIAFVALILPQALGLVGFFWTKHRGTLCKLSTLFIPPLVFFSSAYLFWDLSAQTIQDSGNYVCGAFGAAAFFSTIYGTLMHLIVGVIIFSILTFIWKRKDQRLKQSIDQISKLGIANKIN